jgi:mRNA-degrading endonuclease toxin of MazEF toxin-antitoxin module
VDEEKTALVVSSDVVNQALKPVVVQVTSTDRYRALPTFVPLSAGEGGLMRDIFALCHEIHTLDPEHINPEPLGNMIPMPRLVQVEAALARALDLTAA